MLKSVRDDLDLTCEQIQGLSSAEALAAFFASGLDALTGKTRIFGYLGDYQKDEPETPWSEIEDVLFKNKRHIGANLNDTRFIARLRAEYEKSLDTLRPVKAQLGRTDWLIDQVGYRLYGLTEEEIAVVEGE